MATTTHGYPYPLGTDRVMDGDDVIKALATAVDTQLGVAASGMAAVPTPTVNVGAALAITFPAGRFNVAPNVQATLAAANPNNWLPAGVSSVTTTGAVLNVYRTGGGATTTNVYWHAHVI